MGQMEKRIQKRVRKENIRAAILGTIAVAGVLTVGIAAPNVLKLLKYAPGIRSQYSSRVRRSLDNLVLRGYVTRIGKGKDARVEVTQRGRVLLEKIAIGTAGVRKPKKWDGRWRVVIFDISEGRKSTRDMLRRTLLSIGFLKLQHSVWVYPYACEDLINLIRTDAHLRRDVVYMVVEEIENDFSWRKKFGLSS